MAKYQVQLRWITTEVAHSQIEVEADSPEQAREAAHELIYEQAVGVRWGKPEIIDGEYHIDEAVPLEGEDA